MSRLTCALAFVLVASPVKAQDKPKEDALIREMKFVKVPKGTFWMEIANDKKTSKQEIRRDFELAAYTVTQEQWEAVMGNNPSHFSRQGKGRDQVKEIAAADLKRFPVEMVSWDDIQEFLKKLNERQKGKGWRYRLPNRAEWEYACRNAVTKDAFNFNYYFDKPTNDLSSKQANFNGNYPRGNAEKGPYLGRTTKVGSYAPNKLGLYDMYGNVCQWSADFPETTGFYVPVGFSWDCDFQSCPTATRTTRYEILGFRLARVQSSGKQ